MYIQKHMFIYVSDINIKIMKKSSISPTSHLEVGIYVAGGYE